MEYWKILVLVVCTITLTITTLSYSAIVQAEEQLLFPGNSPVFIEPVPTPEQPPVHTIAVLEITDYAPAETGFIEGIAKAIGLVRKTPTEEFIASLPAEIAESDTPQKIISLEGVPLAIVPADSPVLEKQSHVFCLPYGIGTYDWERCEVRYGAI